MVPKTQSLNFTFIVSFIKINAVTCYLKLNAQTLTIIVSFLELLKIAM